MLEQLHKVLVENFTERFHHEIDEELLEFSVIIEIGLIAVRLLKVVKSLSLVRFIKVHLILDGRDTLLYLLDTLPLFFSHSFLAHIQFLISFRYLA